MLTFEPIEVDDMKTWPHGIFVGPNEQKQRVEPIPFRFTGEELSPDEVEMLRKNTAKKYMRNGHRLHYIMFYRIVDGALKVTDFFKAVLLDPEYYVKHQYNANQPCMVIDEFIVKEVMKNAAGMKKKEGVKPYNCYVKSLVALNNLFEGHFMNELLAQATYDHFKKVSNPSEV